MPPLPPQNSIIPDKLYIKELLAFLIDKHRTDVILDNNFEFTVNEVKKFMIIKRVPAEICNNVSYSTIKDGLQHLKITDRRDDKGKIIPPGAPLLDYELNQDQTGFLILDCRNEYLKNAIVCLDGFLTQSDRKIRTADPFTEASTMSQNRISIQLENGNLIVNTLTGLVVLGRVQADFNPSGLDFKVLLQLAKAYKNNIPATYTVLLAGSDSPSGRANLSCVIRNIKEKLHILPEASKENEDIIYNDRNHGYKLK